MKFLVSLEAHVLDECIPEEESDRIAFWTSLRRGIVWFVVKAMARAALDKFGQPASSNLVAVFDASGFSPASGRWKLSMRINFVERAVAGSQEGRKARDLVVQRLNEAWASCPREGWAAALEPIDQEGDASPEVTDFWDRVVDQRAFKPGAMHRLVWCDAIHGGLPEERPLLPYALLNVDACPVGDAKINGVTVQGPARQIMEYKLVDIELLDGPLCDADPEAADESMKVNSDWGSLGSPWTTFDLPTGGAAQQQAMPAAGAVPPQQHFQHGGLRGPSVFPGRSAERDRFPAAGPVADEWGEHKDAQGKTFFHKQSTGESRWTVFRGPFFDEANRPYYQDLATQATCWQLPADAAVTPAKADNRRR